MRSLAAHVMLVIGLILSGPVYCQEVNKSPLSKLDRNELTPMQRDQWLADVVAVIPSKKGTTMDMAFTPDGKRLAMARSDGTIELWSLTGAKPEQHGVLKLDEATGWASKVAFSKNGAWMASIHGTPGKTLQLWKLSEDGKVKPFASHQLPRIDHVVFHPNNKTIVCGANAGQMFEITDKGLARLPSTLEGANRCFNFANDGTKFVSVVFNPARNGEQYGSEVKFWKIGDKEVEEFQLLQQNRSIGAIALSPDGSTLATGSSDLKVRFWDLTAKPPVSTAPFTMSNWIKNLYFTPDGIRLIAVASGNDILIWNTKEGKQEKIWNFNTKGDLVSNVPFSASAYAPDGRHLAVSTFNMSTTLILRLPLGMVKKRD